MATVALPCALDPVDGWLVQRVLVDAGFAEYTETGLAVHEYECVSCNDIDAEMICLPLNAFVKVRNERAFVVPPSKVPTFSSVLAD